MDDADQSRRVRRVLFVARNPGKPGLIAWRAIQRLVDGSQIEWAGGAGSKNPASVTTLNAADAAHTRITSAANSFYIRGGTA